MKKNVIVYVLMTFILHSSCNYEEHFEKHSSNVVKCSVIDINDDIEEDINEVLSLGQTRTATEKAFSLDENTTMIRCMSNLSPIVADVVIDSVGTKCIALLKNEKGYSFALIYEVVSLTDSEIEFTCFNNLHEPIMSGVYDFNSCNLRLTQIYDNSPLMTRASAAAWGCNLSLSAAGGVWGYAVSFAVAGPAGAVAGAAIGLAYTAFAVYACDGL